MSLHYLRLPRDMVFPIAIDVLIVLVAFLLFGLSPQNPVDCFVTVAVTISMLYLSRAYHRVWSRTSGNHIVTLIAAGLLASLDLLLYDLLFGLGDMSPLAIMLATVLALSGFITVRYRSRLITGPLRRWRRFRNRNAPEAPTRVLIIGANEEGQILARRLQYSEDGYKVVGFIDDSPFLQDKYVEGCRVLGNFDTIYPVSQQHGVDLIVITLPRMEKAKFRHILTECEKTVARIKVLPDPIEAVSKIDTTEMLIEIKPEDLLRRSMNNHHESIDLSPVIGRTVLITGAAGSIGSELGRQFCQYSPKRLILLDNNESGLHDFLVDMQLLHRQIEFVPVLADITDRAALREVFERYAPDVIFHAAAYKHVPMLEHYPQQAVRVNIGGTRNLAELANEYKVERFVLISTDKAVKPSSVMGATKRVCEMIVQAIGRDSSTRFTAVRFGNVLGSRGSVVPIFSRQIDYGGPVTVTDPEMTRYFMSISEACNLVIHAACLTTGKEIYLLRMGKDVRILDLAERMIRLRGLRPNVDIDIQIMGKRPGEKIHEQLFDELAESVCPTIHSGIIQLNRSDEGCTQQELFAWVDRILADGFALNHGNALQTLLTGMHMNGYSSRPKIEMQAKEG